MKKNASVIAKAAKIIDDLRKENAQLRKINAENTLLLCILCLNQPEYTLVAMKQDFDPRNYVLKRNYNSETSQYTVQLVKKEESL